MTPLTIEEFEDRVKTFAWKGRVTSFHVHHTADPITSWRGAASVESIRRYHMNVRGFIDAAQHVLLGPDGTIWPGRDWNLAPASATGHNGRSSGARPFMIEVYGNFTIDELKGVQHANLVRIIAAVQERHNLPADAIWFHKELAPTQCPGHLSKDDLIAAVDTWRNRPRDTTPTTLPAPRLSFWQRFLKWLRGF